jgi:transcriptional regulator with XRE-family HTH domain
VLILEIFCERLKSARIAKKLTQAEAANAIGIKRRGYQWYESGDREPNFEKMKILCEILEVSADYLLGLTDDPSPH